MTNVQHTPGPWQVLEHRQIIQIGTNVFVGSTNDDYPMGEANARLIAAAPDLLAALKAIEAHLSTNSRSAGKSLEAGRAWATEGQHIREQSRAAITKAEGR